MRLRALVKKSNLQDEGLVKAEGVLRLLPVAVGLGLVNLGERVEPAEEFAFGAHRFGNGIGQRVSCVPGRLHEGGKRQRHGLANLPTRESARGRVNGDRGQGPLAGILIACFTVIFEQFIIWMREL